MLEFKQSFKTPKASIKADAGKARKEALGDLIRGVQRGGGRIESYLPSLLDDAMEASIWSWPRTTLRKNGAVAGGSRDIIDRGGLKGSKSVKTKFLQTKTIFTVTYKAPYAALVHYGGYIVPYGDLRRSPVYIPGRPWVEAVLEGQQAGITAIDVSGIMEDAIQSEWGS